MSKAFQPVGFGQHIHRMKGFDGAAPGQCLVIEDSDVGVRAAKSAAMTVWRFAGGSHLKDQPDISLDANPGVPVFRSMDDVAAALLGDEAGRIDI